MSGYGDAALKVQVSSPLSAMLDWQKMQQEIATTGQTQAQTGLLGQQTTGAGIDNQSKLLNLDISRRFAGMAGVGGSAGASPSGVLLPGTGGAPAGQPGAGQGGAGTFGGFQPQQITPYAYTSPFGVPFSQAQMLGIAQATDKVKAMSEAYNMNRQAVAQTLTQAGDISQLSPGTAEYERTAANIREGFTQLYLNGQIDQKAYINGMQHPERANAFIAATASPDAHMSQATAMMGHAYAKDENGNVVPDRGALAGTAARVTTEKEAEIRPSAEKAARVVEAETPGLIDRKRQDLEAGAGYKDLQSIRVPVLDDNGGQKLDKNGLPMWEERYVQAGVRGGSTAVPGQALPTRGVNTRGPALQGPGASDGENPLLGGLEGGPGSLASEGLPAGANVGGTSPNGFQPPAPPPLPPLPAAAGGAAPAAPVVPPAAAPVAAAPGAAAPTPAPLGGNPALTDQQKANVELERNVEQTRQETDIKARAAEVEGVAKTYGEVAGSIVKAGTDTSTKMQRLDVLQNAMEDFRPGVSAETRAAASKRLVDAIQFLGGKPPDWMLKGATGAEVIGKEGGYLAAEMTRMLGAREAASVFNQIKSIQPGLELSTGGFQAIVNSIRQGVQRDHDLFTFQEQWLKSHNSIAGMVNDFNTNHPVEAYASRVIPYPAPQKPSDLKPNVVYRSPNGALGLWDGAQFLPAPTH